MPESVRELIQGEIHATDPLPHEEAFRIWGWAKRVLADAEPDLQFLGLPGKVPIDWADE